MLKKLKFFLLANTSVKQTITKNTIWLLIGQFTSRLLRAAIVVFAARVLGVASWGAFSYALGIATFLTIFSDIGINALITKEATRNPELKDKYLATAFFTKLGLVLLFFLGIITFFPYLSRIPEATLIMPILIFVFVFDTLRDLGSALSRALEQMQIEAGIQIFTNFAIVSLGFIFLNFHKTSAALAAAYALGSGLGLIAIMYALRPHFKNLFKNFRRELVKPIFVTAWPFGLLGLLGVIMLNTDIIMLGWLRSPEEVGYYSAAQKIIQLLYVLPTLFSVSLFPVMARFTKTNPLYVRAMLEKTLALVILCALPIAILGIVFAPAIIGLLFGGAYLPAVLAFQILMLSVLIVYPGGILGYAIFAYDEQKNFIVFVIVATVVNVLLNLLLIPSFGIEGAAAATIITQLITNILIWRKIKSITELTVLSRILDYLKLITWKNKLIKSEAQD